MLVLHTLLLYLVRSQDHSNLEGTREDCQPYDCAEPDGYTFRFGQDRAAPCFWGQYTCSACCYTDFTATGRTCWTPDYPKVNCCNEPWAHDPSCDPNANADCELSPLLPNPADCTACGQILSQEIITNATGTGVCNPSTHICEDGDGQCVVDEFECRFINTFDTCDGEAMSNLQVRNVVTKDQCLVACQESPECAAVRHVYTPDLDPSNFCYGIQSCEGTKTGPVVGDTCIKVTHEPSTSPTVTAIDCVLGILPDPSSCTHCEQVLSQPIISPAQGNGGCAPDTYTCKHLDGFCVEDRDCILGDLPGTDSCTTCGEVLTQPITTQAYGAGTCSPEEYTCVDGDGTCVEDKDCVLGDEIDPSTCTVCDEILKQEILTPEQGAGVCDQATHTCVYGDGLCQEPCEYVEIGNPCPNLDPGAVDYVFLFDTSASLTDEQYNLFMTSLATAVELNLRAEDNFAMVNFADAAVTVVPWTNGEEAAGIAEEIRTTPRDVTGSPSVNEAMEHARETIWANHVDSSRDQRTYVITYADTAPDRETCNAIVDYQGDGIDVYAVLSGSDRYECWEQNDVFMEWYQNPTTMISQHAFVDPSCGTFTPFDGFYAQTGNNDFGPVFANNHGQTLAMSHGDPTLQVWEFKDPSNTVMVAVYLTPGASLRPPDAQSWEYEGPDVLTVAYSDLQVNCKASPYPSLSPVSSLPTKSPSIPPSTAIPTKSPSQNPSITPSGSPSGMPTTEQPTTSPSGMPTKTPSKTPSGMPTTELPTTSPSKTPSDMPTTEDPTNMPTGKPSKSPSGTPTTAKPTVGPTVAPSNLPTVAPTIGCKPFVFGSDFTIPDEIMQARTDFGVILDSSSSVTDEEYTAMMTAWADLVNKYFTYEKERAGLMIYSSFNQHEFPIEQRTPEELAQKFLDSTRIYGATLTSTALYFAHEEMWKNAGILDRNIRQRAILITDGRPSAGQDPCSQINLYLNSNLELYVIAIGDDAYDSLRCFYEDFDITVILVPDIDTLVQDLPKYLQIEFIDKINFDTYYHCTEDEKNDRPIYRSDQGWEAYVDYDGHWTIKDPSGEINCVLKDTEPAEDTMYPQDGRTWTCGDGVFEDTSVQYWSYTPTISPTSPPSIPAPTKGPTVTPPCDEYYVDQIKALKARVDELENQVSDLESEVSEQADDLATCEGKFDELYNGLDSLLSCDSCIGSR